jgi:hypothetical protein
VDRFGCGFCWRPALSAKMANVAQSAQR